MKTVITLLLFGVASAGPSYAFTLSAGTNHVKVNGTTTLSVGDISGSPTDYQWRSDIGAVTDSGAKATFTAPSGKGKATISVTVKNGQETLWSGTVQVLVYKRLVVLKCDDYWYCEWNAPTYIRPTWKTYLDYMCQTARVKTSIEMCSYSLEPETDVTGGFTATTKAYLKTGYVEVLSHGYHHDAHATKDVATLNEEFERSERLAKSKLGISLYGWDWPGVGPQPVSDNVVVALNAAPQIRYAFFIDPPYVDKLTKFSFRSAETRLNVEKGTSALDYDMFLANYAASKDWAVSVIQTHPVWWDKEGAALEIYKRIIAYLKADGATIIFPYDYVRMMNEPAFVPDEEPGGGDASPSVSAAAGSPLKVPLWPGKAPVGDGSYETVTTELKVYLPPPDKAVGAAIVVCPGGGYIRHVMDREGYPIAEWLNAHGIAAVLLEYRLPEGRPWVPLLDAQGAVRMTRLKATEWKVDPGHIGILGFSAGGHVASTAGTHFDAGRADDSDPVERVSCRPDFMLLVYPVVTMGEKTDEGSKAKLLGANPKPELVRLFSNEKQVTERTPPAFLAHARDDTAVPPENSRDFVAALRAHNVAVEYLELPSGGHGLNGCKGPLWEEWKAKSLAWLASRGFLPPEAP